MIHSTTEDIMSSLPLICALSVCVCVCVCVCDGGVCVCDGGVCM